MLVKICGAAMILGSSGLIARHLIYREKKKLERVEGFFELITHVRDRIDTYSTPVKKILADCGDNVKRKLDMDFTPSDFDQIVEYTEPFLDEAGKKILREFSSNLGKSYRDIQIKQCNKTLAELECLKNELYAVYLSRKKTVLALCLGLGGMAVILLI